jgi:SSS family solute:Na+ symporter
MQQRHSTDMSTLDLLIIGAYFAAMLAVGISHSRRASSSIRSYFLGENRGRWWMLAASGAAANFDIAGTMFLVSLFYVTGLRGFWMLWSWSFFNAAFLMVYMAIWIRRTGVVTAVELMKARFGDGRDGRMARTAGAVLMVTFLVFSIGYAFAGLSRFLPVLVPGVGPENGRVLSIGVMVLTTIYVTMGGFSGVVVADVIQLLLSSTAGLAIGVLVFIKLDPTALANLHARFSTDMLPHETLQLPAGYEGWNDFGFFAIYGALSGLLLNMSGAGGHYGEQRFLATRSNTEAAKAGCAWGLFLIPRWAMIVGFVYLAVSGVVTSADPEKILPTVIVDMIPAGFRGLLVAAFLAAFMSTFSSTVNAAASMVVVDLVQPARPSLSTKALIRVSYLATVLVVASGIVIGMQANSIKSIWVWMLAGIIGATLVPNVLRWHWWRFNGWGYALGVFAGLGVAAVIGGGQALGWFGARNLSEYTYAPVIIGTSLIGCVVGSLLTSPTPAPTLSRFYRNVHPFGFWGPVRQMSTPPGEDIGVAPLFFNVMLAIATHIGSYLCVFFLIGHYFARFAATALAVTAGALVLSRTWYRHLPPDPGSSADTPPNRGSLSQTIALNRQN